MKQIIYNEQFDLQLKQLYETSSKIAFGRILHSKKYIYLYQYVMECTSMFDDINLITRVFRVLYHNNEQIRCLTCGKELLNACIRNKNAKTFRDMFVYFCCPSCGQLHPSTKAKMVKTNIAKYGCEHTFQTKELKEKSKQTMLKKYGCQYAQQNKEIKQKSYDTMIKRYGKKYSLQVESIRKKINIAARTNTYNKFKHNKYVVPLFSLDEYIQYGDNIEWKWKCLKCGNEFTSFRNEIWFKEGAVKSYARCEKCYPYDSTYSEEEKAVADFLKTLVNDVQHNTQTNWNIIKPQQLDIYIPSRKIAIEFDGIYWHSSMLKTGKMYHLNKTEKCEKQDIQLIHVFENEWMYKQDIVKSRLKNLLGIYDKTVFARKCEVKEVDSKTSKAFQEDNHIQGAVNAKVNVGLYYDNELISLMTFGKTRFSKKYEWEMLRFCNKLGYHIPGAAGKLLKYFEKTYNPKSLVSYADRRWTFKKSNLYQTLGFSLENISQPNYWYWNSNNRDIKLQSRINFQKHKLKNKLQKFDENLSEIENMRLNGYYAIFDCGNLVYVKTYNT